MPILENQRHELFAQELAKGRTATESYILAGFKPSRKNASRLRSKDDITRRVNELQAASARSAVISVESICRELDEATAVAKERGQAAAMVNASALRAKLAGLMVERVEVGSPGDFEGCESAAQIADRMLDELILKFRPVDARDRAGLIELLNRLSAEMQAYLNAIEARPIIAERVDTRHLDKPWTELQPYSPARLPRSNGQGPKT